MVINDEHVKKFKINDIIYWIFDNKRLNTYINRINKYKNFKECIISEGLRNIFPNKTIAEVLEIYYDTYKKENEEMYGVLAIEVILSNS